MLLLVAALSGAALADDPIPTNRYAFYAGAGQQFNGQLLPLGSIIEAFDQSGVICGRDTVRQADGQFGSMAVYGDDLTTAGVDEGMSTNEEIVFKVNGRAATVDSGTVNWIRAEDDPTPINRVKLSATGVVAMTPVTLPQPQLMAPGQTRRIWVTVRNDGDGLDFYTVTVQPEDTNVSPAWTAMAQQDFVYAQPGEEVDLYFDFNLNFFGRVGATTYNIPFSVYSNLDTTERVDDEVIVTKSITDVDDPVDNLLPGGFALAQNYPNPFNPSTTIGFSLPVRSTVELTIIDLLGRTIERRDLGVLSAGDHEVHYDATGLTSGVYFYRIATDQFSDARKMVLLK